jgi:hypothetical protein
MAHLRPELFTIDEVINFYLANDGSEYKIFATTSPNENLVRFHFIGDKEIGIQELTEGLMQLSRSSDNTNAYLIQVIKPGKGKNKPTLTSISFQLNRPASYLPMQQMGSMSGRSEMLLEKLLESQNVLISRISALENEEIEPIEQKDTLGQIIENPQVQAFAMGLMERFFGNITQPGIAGIPPIEDDAINILKELMSKGVTVYHLKKLNEMSNAKLQSLLLML